MPGRMLRFALSGSAAVLMLAGCDAGRVATVLHVDSLPPTPVIVSNPMLLSSGASAGIAASPPAGAEVAWVSLPSGTIPLGVSFTVRKLHTPVAVSMDMTVGGFDPVPVPAQAGDTLLVTVHKVDGSAEISYYALVPVVRRPIVVRTSPPPLRRDVPWNASITIVFSEPVNAATLTSRSVRLTAGDVVVAGQLSFADSAHTAVTLTPATPLQPSTDYVLVLTQAIADDDGSSLADPVAVAFTTVAAVVPPPPPLSVISTYPASGRTGVPIYQPLLEVDFSADVPQQQIERVQLRRNGVAVGATHWISCQSLPAVVCNTVTVVPDAPLLPGTTYELVADTGAVGPGEPSLALPVVVSFTTEAPASGPTDAVVSVAYSMIAFQYPGYTDWLFAPQVRLSETGNHRGVTVIKMQFSVPVSDTLVRTVTVCGGTGTTAGPGQHIDLMGTAYGDYELELAGAPPTAGLQSTLVLIFRDTAGRYDSVTTSGPVVAGSPPAYDGGVNLHHYGLSSGLCANR